MQNQSLCICLPHLKEDNTYLETQPLLVSYYLVHVTDDFIWDESLHSIPQQGMTLCSTQWKMFAPFESE